MCLSDTVISITENNHRSIGIMIDPANNLRWDSLSGLNLEHIFFDIPVAVYTTDEKGRITYYNKKAAELWKRQPLLNDPHELLYCGSWKMFNTNGDKLDHSDCPMAEALLNRVSFREKELIIEREDGSRIFVMANIDPLIDEEDTLIGAINVFYEITNRKNAEIVNARLAAIVESSSDAIISKNLNSRITSWNKSAERIFGYTEQEVLGKSITIIIPEENQQEESLIISKIKRGERIQHFETIRKKKNGKLIPISLTISPIKNADGKIIGASKIARDISSQKKIEKKLYKTNRKLKRLNQYKDEFISIASHELRTPLTSTKAYLQYLLAMNCTPQQEEIIRKAEDQLSALHRLVIDMLDFSKIQSGNLDYFMEKVDLQELVDECILQQKPHLQKHKITVTGQLHSTITGDKFRLQQVISNILNNAIKYSPNGDVVEVDLLEDKEWIYISINDYGEGIPPKSLEHIFEKYYRARTDESYTSGLGLGLYISNEIIRRHGGEIKVSSALGKGTTFTVCFPKGIS